VGFGSGRGLSGRLDGCAFDERGRSEDGMRSRGPGLPNLLGGVSIGARKALGWEGSGGFPDTWLNAGLSSLPGLRINQG